MEVKNLIEEIQQMLEQLDFVGLQKSIAKAPVLSPLEEKKAFEDLQRLKGARRKVLKDKIVQSNLKLILHIAKKFVHHFHGDIGLLFSEAIPALMRAVDDFDVRRGKKFSTFAHSYILTAIRDFTGRERERRKKEVPDVVTDTDIEGNVVTKIDRYLARRPGKTEDNLLHQTMIKGMMAKLKPKERTIVRMKWVEGKTFKEIGRILGMTDARAEQIEKRALYGQYVNEMKKKKQKPLDFKSWVKWFKTIGKEERSR